MQLNLTAALILLTLSAVPRSAEHEVTVTEDIKQHIRLGVDAERLWFWRSSLKDELAQLAVGEMKSSFVRVAIDIRYEREKGVIKESAYNQTLEMMTAMKKASPGILFFASPQPLHEAYTTEEAIAEWGHPDNVPWSPYPRWILQYTQNGTKVLDGAVVPRWVQSGFDIPALVKYYADYLNLMHQKGFTISFLDATNEKNVITPAINKYLYDSLPGKLNPGVRMPQMIVPSAWNVQGGTDWLAQVNVSKQEHTAFSIAAVHNTGAGGTLTAFVEAATEMGKEPWNTELHDWTGVVLRDEILNSAIFWDHMRAGFVGIETWLFFGPLTGRPHSMIWASNSEIIKSGKYEIFKQVVNNANGGNYVDIFMPNSSVTTSAFVKNNILSIWVLNKGTTALPNVQFNLGNRSTPGKTVDVVRWHETLANAGAGSSFVTTQQHGFAYTVAGESLYFFKIDLSIPVSSPRAEVVHSELWAPQITAAGNDLFIINCNDNRISGAYSLMNMRGMKVKTGVVKGAKTTMNTAGIPRGMYLFNTQTDQGVMAVRLLLR